jgi:sulfite exporter TauE/SafE
VIELPLIFVSGLLGSSHCIGMCGPFAMLLGSATTNWRQNVAWQLLYTAGRIFTYTCLGAMAGFGGQRLAGLQLFGVNATAVLALAAGTLLIYEGLVTAGVWQPFSFAKPGSGSCPSGGLLRSMLQQQSRWGVFLAGIATGFLPCGLVYAFLLIAARSGDLILGALVMAVFGLGTLPLMVATGTSASFISLERRTRMLTLAGWCVVIMGTLSLYRGMAFLTVDDPSACPFCL